MRRSIPSAGFAALILPVALAACSGAPPIEPAPAPPVPVPAPAPAPAPAPILTGDWRDWPLTPGDWRYRHEPHGSIATFGGERSVPVLSLRCDRARHRVELRRARATGAASAPSTITVRTSSMVRAVAVGLVDDALAGALDARDPLLDAMGFSRGRFVVEGGGLPVLVIPAWPEILRVVEDCRS